MVTQAEAERVIRRHAAEWANETGYTPKPGHYPSFPKFKVWLNAKGLRGYLRFRPNKLADATAEAWFEDELRTYGRTL